MTKPSLSLVIAVYNAVGYLEMILAALERQTMRDFEVIVADDGSGPAVRDLIEKTRADVDFPLVHLWQEDSGFGKNIMLNKSIAAAGSDYLVFIDGDCLPHREFLADHWRRHAENRVLCGRRVNFSGQITAKLGLDDIRSGRYERLSLGLLVDGALARSSNLEDAVRIENEAVRWLFHRNRAQILGCNFSVAKEMLERINGFNEDYRGPGLGEDSDVEFRLRLNGAQFMSLRNLAILYHLYHPATVVGEANKELYRNVVEAGEAVCRRGLRHLDAVGTSREPTAGG